MHAVRKYLESWAEPETRLAASIEGPYERALVVPACAESISLLDGYTTAAQTSRGRTLLILVVNAPDEAGEETHAENRTLLEGLREKLKRTRAIDGPPAAFTGTVQLGNLDVLVVDRASPGSRVPRKEGVGLARKLGTDLALQLHVAGKVRSPYLFTTDADATLPETYFDVPELDARTGVAAVLFPFWHESSSDMRVTRATALYELSLRYYVAGLAWAGSPYAFHTLGSAMAVGAEAYAAVRGFPKREAAEDFYLLNKIAKVGAVVRMPGSAVRLRSRTSDRTPFGTGAAVARAVGGEEQLFYAPATFTFLRKLLELLNSFAEHADADQLFSELARLAEAPRDAITAVLSELDAKNAFQAAADEAKTTEARRLRVHTWFDAFRTLKVIHALRDRVAPDVRCREALESAPFSPTRGTAEGAELVAARYAFARAEAGTPMIVGPWR